MREILFKAKRLDNGEWVHGYIVRHPSAIQIGESSSWYIHVPPVDPDDNGGVFNVDSDTICQYTGLTDKNSAKIFEDDKLSDKYGDTGIVKFGWNYGTHGFFCEGAVDDITDNDLLVIGNIHNEED